jgi:hypothetical protein
MQVIRFWTALALTPMLFLPAVGDEPKKIDQLPDYTEFSKLVHKIVVSQLPKVHQDDSGWGGTVPLQEKLRLPRLRTYVKVGDRIEVPHGFWRKVKVWLDDPAEDLTIRVRELKPIDAKIYRLSLDAEAELRGWTEVQHWQKGLALVGFIANADAIISLSLDCDVAVSLKPGKFPPEVAVEPKVTRLKLDLKDFILHDVTLRRLGRVLEGEQARDAADQFRGILKDLVRAAEPMVKDHANRAIEKGLREGKGTISAGALFKALGAGAKKAP